MKYEAPTAQMLKDTVDKWSTQLNNMEMFFQGMVKTDRTGTVEIF